jgi:hypothetical protein
MPIEKIPLTKHTPLACTFSQLNSDREQMGNDIPLQDREIRLLFLLHNDYGAEDIKYTLLRTTIDRAPPYEALSYAWGEDLCQMVQ